MIAILRSVLVSLAVATLVGTNLTLACTSIIVSRGASKDGSVMVTYSADAPFMPRLLRVPGGKHAAGSTVEVKGWEDGHVRGTIPQTCAAIV